MGARGEIDTAERVLVSTMSVWEIATLVRRGRISLDRDVLQWCGQALGRPATSEVPIDAAVALTAGSLPDAFPGDPGDRLIYATAVVCRAALITRDERITAFDPERCRW